MTRRERAIEPMNSFEYQEFYDTGKMPERFWTQESARLRDEYAIGEITVDQLEHELEAMMGFPA